MRVLILLLLVLFTATSSSIALETKAKQAIIIDDTTGTTLFGKEADARMYPASMTKMMTAYLVFKELASGKLTLDSTYHVSKKSWKMGGSKMFVELGNTISIEDLLRGIIVQSGNDACVVVAEGMAGSEEAFAEMMNQEAARMGMTGTHFVNATGWPHEEHYTTARDLAILSHHLIHDFPQYYSYFAEAEYRYHEITQYNRNLLLGRNLGVDGLKTGHTEASGYGMAVSAERDGRRVITVVNGLTSKKERADEAQKLVNLAYGAYEHVVIAGPEVSITEIPLWYGDAETVSAGVSREARMVAPKVSRKKPEFIVEYNSPVPAPVVKGQQIGVLHIRLDGLSEQTIPLVALQQVEEAGSFRRIWLNINYLLQ